MKCIYINKIKIIAINIIIYFCIFIFLTNSQACITSISNSTNLFVTKLLPALLPSILLTELVINLNVIDNLSYGFTKIICRIFKIPNCAAPTIIISYLLGYPNAAKHILKLYERKEIDLYTAKKLVAFTNNANPAYIVGTIGIAMFNSTYIGLLLLASHILSSCIIGISYSSNKFIIQQNKINSNSFKQISLGFKTLLKSLLNSVKTLIIIWGFTVIFSLTPALLLCKLNLSNYIYGLTVGICELSNGINILTKSNLDITVCLVLISFILSFSSLMVIFQIYSFTYKCGIKISYIIRYKLLHGTLSSLITYVFSKLILKNNNVLSVFNNNDLFLIDRPIPTIFYISIAIMTSILLVIITAKKKR